VGGSRPTQQPGPAPCVALASGDALPWRDAPSAGPARPGPLAAAADRAPPPAAPQVISGADKGKVGEVITVYPKTGKVVVKDVNIVTKHNKPRAQGEPGNISKEEGPIHASNVMHYSTEKGVRSRVGTRVEGGKKVRFLKKTGETLN